MNELPQKAFSIRQPWAWLVVNGIRDVDNRDWETKYRGPVLVHAGKKLDRPKSSVATVCRNLANRMELAHSTNSGYLNSSLTPQIQ